MPQQVFLQDAVHLKCQADDGVYLVKSGDAQRHGVIPVDKRVVQGVVFIAEFDGGALQHRALRHTQALGKAARGHIAHNHFQRHNLYFLHQGFALRKLLHKMRGHAFFFQQFHHVVGKTVVYHAFATDCAALCAVAGRGVIFIIYNHQGRVIGGKHLFGLSLVQLFPFFHCGPPLCRPPVTGWQFRSARPRPFWQWFLP